jgi:S1-C subfamily serine protease
VIAIGNALAEFRNSVTMGVVSGLNRSLMAGDLENEELIEEAIQTDAAINPGNSGGPLITLDGKVVGMNTAVSDGAQSLGFALPSNALARAVESVQKFGRIVRPWIGVRYIPVDAEVAQSESLSKEYGALILGNGRRDPGIVVGSPASKADLRERDVILEIDGERVGDPRSLATIISRLAPEQTVILKIARGDKELQIPVKLEERPQQ